VLLSVWSLKRRVFDNQPSLYSCSVCALQYVNLLLIDYRVYTEVCSVRSINTERYRPKCRLGSLVVRALDSRLDGREFDSRPPRLILGWATVFGRAGKPLQHFTKPPRPTQRPTLSGTGNEYQPKCVDALRLGSKGRCGSFHLWINVWVVGKTV